MASAKDSWGGHGWLGFIKHVVEELLKPIPLHEISSKGRAGGARQCVGVTLWFFHPLGPECLGSVVEVAKKGIQILNTASVEMGLQTPVEPRSGTSRVTPRSRVDSRIRDGDANVVANVQLVHEAMQVFARVWS